jgi:hypothetical protein
MHQSRPRLSGLSELRPSQLTVSPDNLDTSSHSTSLITDYSVERAKTMINDVAVPKGSGKYLS